MIRRISFLTIIVVLASTSLFSQTIGGGGNGQGADVNVDGRDGRHTANTISTAVSFLNIAPDTRAGALGDAGVATNPDGNSQHWNPSKYVFIENDFGVSLSYTPWLRALSSDMNLGYVAGYYKFNPQNAIGASLLFFDLGSMTFKDVYNNTLATFRPREFSLDISYARLLAKNFSGSVAMRFIYSNLTGGMDVNGSPSKAGTSVAADVSFYYKNDDIMTGNLKSSVMWGMNISNIGSKISYTDTQKRDFIPTNFRTGVGYMLSFDEHNDLLFTCDFNKLLVPTPPSYYGVGDTLPDGYVVPVGEGQKYIKYGKDPNISVPAALFTSWWDAPGDEDAFMVNGKPSTFLEELAEITLSVGLEYCYSKQFAVRVGYFHEHAYKGNRKYFTVGAGLRLNVFGLDFAYLIPVTQANPLQNTLRFTLTFDFGGMAKEQRDAKKAEKEARKS